MHEGDIFAWRMPDELYRFGRVVYAGVHPIFEIHVVVVYLYSSSATTKIAPPSLARDRLLIPPLFLGTSEWHRGMFEKVAFEVLQPIHLLDVHCFWYASRDRYVDLAGRPLDGRYEPCGDFALTTPWGLDTALSRALGIPLCLPDPVHLMGKDRRCFRKCLMMLESRGHSGDAAELGALRATMMCYEHVWDAAEYGWPAVPGMPSDEELRKWATRYRAEEEKARASRR